MCLLVEGVSVPRLIHCVVVPAGRVREINHSFTLWLKGEEPLTSSNLDSMDLAKFKMSPACVDVCDLVPDNGGSAEGLTRMVRGQSGGPLKQLQLLHFYFTFLFQPVCLRLLHMVRGQGAVPHLSD